MRVSVVCFGALRAYLPVSDGRNRADLELETGSRVGDVVAALKIPEGLVYALLVDGERATPDEELHDEAEVTLMPPFAGGA